ncbi:MAG TPA: CBS domain-containing protein [Synergistaceae bacterium]|nr:CBS domain-containing protein [Synergistaceae bacterium]HPQ36968.1 CBS domain-containing protein [Synergistaceae bacterium]
MILITSHIGADFDSLAAMVAASKLYGPSELSFSGSATRNVREYVKRYGTRWKVLTPKKVCFSDVTLLVCVDVRSLGRIGPFRRLVEERHVPVHVYDHHPPLKDAIPAEKEIIAPVGAVTTLLVELLRLKKIPISPQEATLFAMGIYEDTGGLTFGGTSSRDFDAVKLLKEEYGADLTMVATHVEFVLQGPEQALLDRLMESAREFFLRGARIVFARGETSSYVEGLSLFVHRLKDYFDADVAIAVVRMERRVYIVGRSREKVLHMGDFLVPWGGGGHPQAAAATVVDGSVEEICRDLENRLLSRILPRLLVEDVMSSPVMVLSTKASVDEAYRVMLRYGHSAIPLVSKDVVLGIITRKDLDKAKLHGLGSVPVEDFMTGNPLAVSPSASVEEAHRLLVFHNIGRLPVVEKGFLRGIITRTDVLRALYPASLPEEERTLENRRPWEEDLSLLLRERLAPWMTALLERLGARADALGSKAYLVGGFVRDIILGMPSEDVDIVIEGDAVAFLESWRSDGCRVAIHTRFSTGTIVFPGDRKVDVAASRREFYEYPVAQPSVSTDSLKHDLYRRDYAVNAMAVCINGKKWGTLIDYFGGRRDIQRRTLRALHNLSFVEDPTRILRGVRLEQRLRFRIEENTLRLLLNCVRGGLLTVLSGVRLRSEIELIFREHKPFRPAERLWDLGVWKILFSGVRFDSTSRKAMRRISAILRWAGKDLPDFGKELWLAFFAAFLYDSPPETCLSVCRRLSLNDRESRLLRKMIEETGRVENELGGSGHLAHSAIYEFLSEEELLASLFWASATSRWRVRRRILLYLTRLQKMCPMLGGKDVIDLGVTPGRTVGFVLRGLLVARLDGDVETREDEIAWVLKQHHTLPKGRKNHAFSPNN